jgi:hypothetical protein
MIETFKIRNYYSIKGEQTLSFVPAARSQEDGDVSVHKIKNGVHLLKLGIIYGANASGKTNLLRALDDFRKLQVSMPEDKLSGVPFVPFMLDETSRNDSTDMEMSFYVKGIKYILSLSYNAKRIIREELRIRESSKIALVYHRTYNAESDQPQIEFGTKVKLNKKSQQAIISNTLNNSTVMAAFGKTNVESSYIDDVYAFFSQSMKAVLQPNMILSAFVKSAIKADDTNKLKPFILEMLKQSDFNIVNMNIHEEEDMVSSDISKATYKHDELSFAHRTEAGVFNLPETLESIGTMRFMGMSVLLSKLLFNNAFVSIDEIESSIHYELVAYFIKVFLANSENDSQMLLTTHDINLMNEDFIRKDALWSADKTDSGETTLNRFSDMGLHKSMSVYNAYRQGKLGQLPFVGNIFLKLESNDKAQ